MRVLNIDIETYSSVDLLKSGVYKYAQAKDFEILLFACSFDDGPVEIYEPGNGGIIPLHIQKALVSDDVLKTAYNANFERTCISAYLGAELPVHQWECTMVKAAMLGLPMGLGAVASALGLPEEKSAAGKALIRYFSLPCKPTKANGQRTRNLPEHDEEKWKQFMDYCHQDVVVEKAIRKELTHFSIPQREARLWQLDQQINDRGVLLDPLLVKNAVRIDNEYREKLTAEAIKLTGLNNPNSTMQLKAWISQETDEEIATLNKEAIPGILQTTDSEVVKRVLKLRQEMSKTSVKKYQAMAFSMCNDKRVRGLLQFYGANRTGRWAGRLVQVQNLKQNHLPDLDLAREVVRQGDLELLEILFGDVADVLGQLVRTAFVAPEGHRLIVSDLSAIEARIIAWLAGEKWRLDVFNTHGKIYEASASQMFKIPIEKITKGSDLRQRGKVAELALGYQGGPNALISMGALKMGLQEEELPKLVAMWRQANRAITKFWDDVNEAALTAVSTGSRQVLPHGLSFYVAHGNFYIGLPSGRSLCYLRPRIKPGRYGSDILTYQGMDQTTRKWTVQDTYGGKLVENIVQATARDVLADAMIRLDDAGYKIILHVHDEVVSEMPIGKGSLEEVNGIMGATIPWAKGLPLKADGFETTYYKKE